MCSGMSVHSAHPNHLLFTTTYCPSATLGIEDRSLSNLAARCADPDLFSSIQSWRIADPDLFSIIQSWRLAEPKSLVLRWLRRLGNDIVYQSTKCYSKRGIIE